MHFLEGNKAHLVIQYGSNLCVLRWHRHSWNIFRKAVCDVRM